MPGELAPAAIFGFVILKLDYSSRTYLYRFSLISNVFFESLYPVSLNIEKCIRLSPGIQIRIRIRLQLRLRA